MIQPVSFRDRKNKEAPVNFLPRPAETFDALVKSQQQIVEKRVLIPKRQVCVNVEAISRFFQDACADPSPSGNWTCDSVVTNPPDVISPTPPQILVAADGKSQTETWTFTHSSLPAQNRTYTILFDQCGCNNGLCRLAGSDCTQAGSMDSRISLGNMEPAQQAIEPSPYRCARAPCDPNRAGQAVSAGALRVYAVVTDGAMAEEFPHRFSTKQNDQNTALTLFEYRIYYPAIGRFLSKDPLAEISYKVMFPAEIKGEKSTEFIHVYSYVYNSPLYHCDKLGLRVMRDSCASNTANNCCGACTVEAGRWMFKKNWKGDKMRRVYGSGGLAQPYDTCRCHIRSFFRCL